MAKVGAPDSPEASHNADVQAFITLGGWMLAFPGLHPRSKAFVFLFGSTDGGLLRQGKDGSAEYGFPDRGAAVMAPSLLPTRPRLLSPHP